MNYSQLLQAARASARDADEAAARMRELACKVRTLIRPSIVTLPKLPQRDPNDYWVMEQVPAATRASPQE
jgi:hypothetical protein